jgi:hypothetical protein
VQQLVQVAGLHKHDSTITINQALQVKQEQHGNIRISTGIQPLTGSATINCSQHSYQKGKVSKLTRMNMQGSIAEH